jgi:pimeloyl-ACP methyl ester carboxylesterase
MKPILTLLTALLLAPLAALHAAEPEAQYRVVKGTCPMGREYYLYLPPVIDPVRTYWLVAGIHGRGGNGKDTGGALGMVANGNCIVVGPSFPAGHKVLAKESDQQLIGLFKLLSQQYRLHDRLFVTGFSAGGQFTQRFAFRHPDLIIGCAPNSAGTWMTGDDNGGVAFDPAMAQRFPLVMSCGMKDTGTTTPDEFTPPHLKPRIEWAHEFDALLAKNGFFYRSDYFPGVAHSVVNDTKALIEDCFHLSTTGLLASQRPKVEELLAPVANAFKAGAFDQAKQAWPAVRASLLAARWPWPGDPANPTALVEGWHTNPVIKQELERRREAFIKELLDEWTKRLEAPAP